MSKILLAHPSGYGGDDLKWFLEEEGHSVNWYQFRDQVRAMYDNIPEYDVAIVDRCINGSPAEKGSMGLDCDDVVKKLKQVHPKKKVICLTHIHDPCKYADKNLGIITEGILEELLEEVKI